MIEFIVKKFVLVIWIVGICMMGYYCDCGKGFVKFGWLVGCYIVGKVMCFIFDEGYWESDVNFEFCFFIKWEVLVVDVDCWELVGGEFLLIIYCGFYD